MNIKVWEVAYNLDSDGRFGDGIEIYRTRSQKDAESFAKGKTCYSGPAQPHVVLVPKRIAIRWGLA